MGEEMGRADWFGSKRSGLQSKYGCVDKGGLRRREGGKQFRNGWPGRSLYDTMRGWRVRAGGGR